MAYQLFTLPKPVNISGNLTLQAGAKANFYEPGTTTPRNTYQDSALATPHTNPVVADSAGVLPPIYLDPSLQYKLTLTTSADVLIYTVDPVNDQVLSQSIIGGLLYPRTSAEIAAGVTPTNYAYELGDVRRYGAVGDGATDDTAAIQKAINSVGVAGEVIFPAIGIYLCAGSLTGLNFQTWSGHSYELGAGGSQAALKCSKTSGTFITTGSNQKFDNIRFLGVVTYTDATGATAGSTATAMKLTDSVTFRDCVFQLQYRCVETTGFSANYIRMYGGEVVRCGQFLNIVDGDAFNVQVDGTVFRLCSTFSASSASPKKYIHNLKVQGGSFESWVGLFNSIRTASFFGTYFESDIVGGIAFNSDGSFIDKDTSISLFGCFLFLNNLDRFVNFSGLNGCTFVSIGNLIAGAVNSGQNQYYFVPQNAGSGRTVMLGDYLDDRGTGTFQGTYVSDNSKVRNQLIVWPRGTTADHANAGQTWVDGGLVFNPVTFATSDATPSVKGGSIFRTADTTTLTAFDDGVTGQTITLFFDHAVTVDCTGTTLKGNAGADISAAAGDWLEAKFDGTNWRISFHDCTA